MDQDLVDHSLVVEGRCPICGRIRCLRELTPYGRCAISLFPFVKRWLLVARFLCRKTKRTVSLLPMELVPYHPYAIPSMLHVLWLCTKMDSTGGPKRFLRVLLDAVTDTDDVGESLVLCWLVLMLRGFQRAHGVLRQWFDLSEVTSGVGMSGKRRQWRAYLCACRVRGPPNLVGDMMGLVKSYSDSTHRFLLGIPSQDCQTRQ
jgi:hypothetical protein